MQVQAKQCSVITRSGRQCCRPAVLGDKCLIHQKDPSHKPFVREGFWLDGQYIYIPVPKNIDDLIAMGQPPGTKQGKRKVDDDDDNSEAEQ